MTSLSKLKARTASGVGKNFKHEIPISMMSYIDLKTTRLKGHRYYITPDNKLYPSATSFLKYFDDGEWKKKWIENVGVEKAAAESKRCTTRGTQIHLALEKYCKNEANPDVHAGEYRRMYNQIRKVLARKLDRVVCQEHALYSDILKLAGRVDLIGYWDGVLSVIDFKNSNRMKKADKIEDYYLQTSLYSLMFQERYGIKIEQLVILNSMESGEKDECQVLISQRSIYIPILKERLKTFHAESGVYDDLPVFEGLDIGWYPELPPE